MMRERDIARMIRVDQAGEFGATRIYQGQLDVMGDRGPHAAEIAEMAAAAAAARVEQMRTRELDAVARRIEPSGGGRRRRSLRRQKAMAALSEAIEATAEATADHVPEGTLKTLWEAARDCYAAWEAAESEQLG